jgi:uncharacterized protein
MTSHLFLLLLAAMLACSQAQGSECSANTIQITGNGQVSLNPDIVSLSISATGNGSTAKTALSNLNGQINTILGIFSAQNIPSANYSTSSININQVYDYSKDPVTITGSQATQSLHVTLSINALPALLQSLTNVNTTIQSLNFDVFDKSSALQKARGAAFVDASNKFNQYLSLSGLTSDGLKKLTDMNS